MKKFNESSSFYDEAIKLIDLDQHFEREMWQGNLFDFETIWNIWRYLKIWNTWYMWTRCKGWTRCRGLTRCKGWTRSKVAAANGKPQSCKPLGNLQASSHYIHPENLT